jgi:hypothetical protein
MKLTLTFTNSDHNIEKDFQLNSQQKIADTLEILQNAGIFPQILYSEPRVKSLRRSVYVDKARTYEEEQIYNGDILELC